MAWEIDESKLREGEKKYFDELNRRLKLKFKLTYGMSFEERGYVSVSELEELAEEVIREYDLELRNETVKLMNAGEITLIDFSLMET
jgi:hypothetical protein